MTERTLDDETRYVLLRRLADNPRLSQRELAKELGMSLGKVNYCLKAGTKATSRSEISGQQEQARLPARPDRALPLIH